MQEQHLFEYAVIRVVPKVEREEFLNVGVILFCKKQGYLRTAVALNEEKLEAIAPFLEKDEIAAYLHALQIIAHGEKGSGPIGQLDAAARFRWLTATRSTVIQTSRIHPGFCSELDTALDKLMAQYVW